MTLSSRPTSGQLNTLRHRVLNGFVQLPDAEFTSGYVESRPCLGGLHAEYDHPDLSTQELLKSTNIEDFRDITRLRKHDIRTILVVRAPHDHPDDTYWYTTHAVMNGCVMTIYLKAFDLPVCISEIRPGSIEGDTLFDFTNTLSMVINHELWHHIFVGKGKLLLSFQRKI
jgi:hypothetical protein